MYTKIYAILFDFLIIYFIEYISIEKQLIIYSNDKFQSSLPLPSEENKIICKNK